MRKEWNVEQILKDMKPLLTDIEYKFFEMYLYGYSINQIAKELKINKNAIPGMFIYLGKKLREIEEKEGGIV